MGCWNETCAISQIAILSGDPVVCLFLARNGERPRANHTGTDAEWTPMLLPFRASYNDYGWVEDIEEDWNTAHIIEMFRYHTRPMAEGNNPYHERAVVPSELDWDSLETAIRDERLEVVTFSVERLREAPVPVCMVMIHAKVWDSIVNTGYTNFRGVHTRDSVTKDLEEAYERAREVADDRYGHRKESEPALYMASLLTQIHMEMETSPMRGIGEYRPRTISSYLDSDRFLERGTEGWERMAELCMVCRVMQSLRRSWQPQTGAGSQNNDHSIMRLLSNIVEGVFREREREWDEE